MSDGLPPSWVIGFATVLAMSVFGEVLMLVGFFD